MACNDLLIRGAARPIAVKKVEARPGLTQARKYNHLRGLTNRNHATETCGVPMFMSNPYLSSIGFQAADALDG